MRMLSKYLLNSAAKQQTLLFDQGLQKIVGAQSDGDRNAIWWYFVSMSSYLAMLLWVSIGLSYSYPGYFLFCNYFSVMCGKTEFFE